MEKGPYVFREFDNYPDPISYGQPLPVPTNNSTMKDAVKVQYSQGSNATKETMEDPTYE